MATNKISIRDLATDYITFQMYADGSVISLAGIDHVELNVRDKHGVITTFTSSGGSPKLFITDSINGIIELRPAATDFYYAKSPYKAYMKIYETASRWYAIPEDTEMTIIVREGF